MCSKFYRPMNNFKLDNEEQCNEFLHGKLESSIKKLFSNICETLITFQHKLQINGTIGLTIDDENMMLIHFCETIHSPSLNESLKISQSPSGSSKPNSEKSFDITKQDFLNPCCNIDSIINTNSGQKLDYEYSSRTENSIKPGFSTFNDNSRGHSDSVTLTSSLRNPFRDDLCSLSLNKTILELSNDILTSKQLGNNETSLANLLKVSTNKNTLFSSDHVNDFSPWKPNSAAEALKRMSCRADASSGFYNDKGDNLTANDVIKNDLDLKRKRALKSNSNPHLKELLFHKKSDDYIIKHTLSGPDKKARIHTGDSDTTDIIQNISLTNDKNLLPEDDKTLIYNQEERNNVKCKSDTSSYNCNELLNDHSEYHYSMLLHHLVDVRRNFGNSNEETLNGKERSQDIIDDNNLNYSNNHSFEWNNKNGTQIKSEIKDTSYDEQFPVLGDYTQNVDN